MTETNPFISVEIEVRRDQEEDVRNFRMFLQIATRWISLMLRKHNETFPQIH